MIGLWLLWAGVLLVYYYRQIGRLLIGGSDAWPMLAQDLSASRAVILLVGLAAGAALWQVFGRALWRRSAKKPGRRLPSFMLQPSFLQRWVWAAAALLFIGGLAAASRLPHFDEALRRSLSAIFGGGAMLLAAFGLGQAVIRELRWRPEHPLQAILFQMGCGLAALSVLLTALAFLGWYRPLVVQTVILLLAAGGGAWLIHALFSQRPSSFTLHPSSLINSPWSVIIGLALLLALIGALAPEVEYDALWYHLWLPRLWLAQGGPVDIVSEYISLYPSGTELLYGAAMSLADLVSGGAGAAYASVAAKLLAFAFLALGALLAVEMTRRFARRASPAMAGALFVSIPIILWEGTTAYVDLALTLPVGLALYALLCHAAQPGDDSGRQTWLSLAIINMGFALTVKHLALPILGFFCGGLLLKNWLRERSLKPGARDWRRILAAPILLGAASLVFGLPWYLRSWLAAGNPFFPDLYTLFGAFPPERWNDITERALNQFKAHFGRPLTVGNLLTLPWDMTFHATRYGGTLGPLLALFLPGLIPWSRRRLLLGWKSAAPWLAGFGLLYLGLWASPVSSLQMRFLLPITPLLAVLAAQGFWQISAWGRKILRRRGLMAINAGMILLLLLNLPPFISLHEGDRDGWMDWLNHVVRQPPVSVVIGREAQDKYLRRILPSYAAWQYINTQLPPDAYILTFSGGDHLYSERRRLWSDATLARPAVWHAPDGSEAQALSALRRLGVTHLLFDKRQLASLPADTLAIAQTSFLAQWGRLEYEDNYYSLYHFQP